MPKSYSSLLINSQERQEFLLLVGSGACNLEKAVSSAEYSRVNRVRGGILRLSGSTGRPEDIFLRLFYADLPSRLSWAVSRWWYGMRASWRARDNEPWVFALGLGSIGALFVFALQAGYTRRDERRHLDRLSPPPDFFAPRHPLS